MAGAWVGCVCVEVGAGVRGGVLVGVVVEPAGDGAAALPLSPGAGREGVEVAEGAAGDGEVAVEPAPGVVDADGVVVAVPAGVGEAAAAWFACDGSVDGVGV